MPLFYLRICSLNLWLPFLMQLVCVVRIILKTVSIETLNLSGLNKSLQEEEVLAGEFFNKFSSLNTWIISFTLHFYVFLLLFVLCFKYLIPRKHCILFSVLTQTVQKCVQGNKVQSDSKGGFKQLPKASSSLIWDKNEGTQKASLRN